MNNIKNLFLLIIVLFPFVGYGQFSIKVLIDKTPIYLIDGDTISTCRDTVITFKVESRNGIDTVFGADYFWDFDDEQTDSGEDLDSVTHVFEKGGGYRVKLTVISEFGTKKRILPVRIAMPPEFTPTKPDLPDGQTSVCKGGTVALIGKATPVLWEDEPVYEVTEDSPKLISISKIYSSVLRIDEFLEDAKFTSGDIDSVGVNLEHTSMGDLHIKLICPEGKEMVLKTTSPPNHSDFGEPIKSDNDSVGKAYKYYWTPFDSRSMNTYTDDPIQESISYKPDESFTLLNGCSMNGEWVLEITDNTEENTGFISSWELSFSKKADPPVWKFIDTIAYTSFTYWNGKFIHGTNSYAVGDTAIGLTNSNPSFYGENEYTFNIQNNWNCPSDTTIKVMVTAPTGNASPASGNAPLDVTFSCDTDWAKHFVWEFGRHDKPDTNQTADYTYPEKGKYEVILTALDDNLCKDYDTIQMDIQVEPSSVDLSINVFTPNSDGVNDVFKLKDAKAMAEFKLIIFNRWGEKVYETESTEEATKVGWDGRMPHTHLLASPGMYFYVIKAVGKDDKKYKESGSFQIFR